jgi:hypothetical protein
LHKINLWLRISLLQECSCVGWELGWIVSQDWPANLHVLQDKAECIYMRNFLKMAVGRCSHSNMASLPA